jgi:hypothetical protein
MQLELLPARTYHRKYYPANNNPATGWFVLVDGQPHHFFGPKAKREAREWMEAMDLKFNNKEAQNEKPD